VDAAAFVLQDEFRKRRIAQREQSRSDQCDELPSSLLLVANRIEAAKTAIMTGTTKKGEVMLIRQSP
jgi:hypothetical protein